MMSLTKTEFPPSWGPQQEPPPGPDRLAWWRGTRLEPLGNADDEALLVLSLVQRSCPTARLVKLQRVQNRTWWRDYCRAREDVTQSSDVGANERFLFHGTSAKPPEEILASAVGLDARFGGGGFFGQGIYFAEDAAYTIGGRYAHRVVGSGGSRLKLIVVRAALGTQQDLGGRIDDATKAMKHPGVRVTDPVEVLYNSVRAGPHRPFIAGRGDGSVDASLVHVVYESRQCYPAFVVELAIGGGGAALAPPRARSAAAAAAFAAAAARAPPAPPTAKRPNASSPVAAPAAKQRTVDISVKNDLGAADDVLYFRVTDTTPLGKLLKCYADRKGVDVDQIEVWDFDSHHYDDNIEDYTEVTVCDFLPSQILKCPLSQGLLVDPMISMKCRHTYSKASAASYFKQSKKCAIFGCAKTLKWPDDFMSRPPPNPNQIRVRIIRRS